MFRNGCLDEEVVTRELEKLLQEENSKSYLMRDVRERLAAVLGEAPETVEDVRPDDTIENIESEIRENDLNDMMEENVEEIDCDESQKIDCDVSESKTSTKPQTGIYTEDLFGEIVWARISKKDPWWPAIVCDPDKIGSEKAKVKGMKARGTKYSVYFYGSENFGFPKPTDIRPYAEFYEEFSTVQVKKKGLQEQFKLAIEAADDDANISNEERSPTVDELVSDDHTNDTAAALEAKPRVKSKASISKKTGTTSVRKQTPNVSTPIDSKSLEEVTGVGGSASHVVAVDNNDVDDDDDDDDEYINKLSGADDEEENEDEEYEEVVTAKKKRKASAGKQRASLQSTKTDSTTASVSAAGSTSITTLAVSEADKTKNKALDDNQTSKTLKKQKLSHKTDKASTVATAAGATKVVAKGSEEKPKAKKKRADTKVGAMGVTDSLQDVKVKNAKTDSVEKTKAYKAEKSENKKPRAQSEAKTQLPETRDALIRRFVDSLELQSKKIISLSDDAGLVLSVMRRLERMNPTLVELKTSRAAEVVCALRKHEHPDVSSAAKTLRTQWKQQASGTGSGSGSGSATKTTTPQPKSKPSNGTHPVAAPPVSGGGKADTTMSTTEDEVGVMAVEEMVSVTDTIRDVKSENIAIRPAAAVLPVPKITTDERKPKFDPQSLPCARYRAFQLLVSGLSPDPEDETECKWNVDVRRSADTAQWLERMAFELFEHDPVKYFKGITNAAITFKKRKEFGLQGLWTRILSSPQSERSLLDAKTILQSTQEGLSALALRTAGQR
eukprot:gene1830-3544_t